MNTISINKKSASIRAVVAAAALALGAGLAPPAQASDPFLGQITMFGGNFAPRGWAFCEGQLLPINQNTALFSLLGNIYGGDGRTNFALPDLRGRVAIHAGNGPGLSTYSWGQKGGLERVTLTLPQIPAHTHTATAVLHATDTSGTASTPDDTILANKRRTNIYSSVAPNVTMNSAAVTVSNANAGGGQAHENRMPYLAVNYIIALQGVFPSRN